MRTLSKIFSVSFLVFFGWEFSAAQVNNNNNNNTNNNNQSNILGPKNLPRDAAYDHQDASQRRVVPPAYMRASDIMWEERVWRVIDTRQKINEQLYYPVQKNLNRISLYDLLKQALVAGELTAYSFNAVDWDDYSEPLTLTEVKAKLSSVDTIPDENGNMKAVVNDITSDKIRGYMLKEDWHFEKQRSVIDPRILWICPQVVTINKNTQQEDPTAGNTNLFWLYFPDLRPLLAKTPVFNQENDAQWLSLDDIFWKRQFASYIVQQSNVFNRSIEAYMKGLDALAEGNKIHDKIQAIENDMWQY